MDALCRAGKHRAAAAQDIQNGGIALQRFRGKADVYKRQAQIVVNTTPAGMYPNVGVCNLDVAAMPGQMCIRDRCSASML